MMEIVKSFRKNEKNKEQKDKILMELVSVLV